MPNAIVTGGNSGIGRATAIALAASGFDVGFTWHAESERAASAVEEVEAHGRRAVMRQVDLHDGEAGARVVEELADALGSVDCFVSNAGYGTSKSVLETTAEEWRGVVEVDPTAAFLCFQAAVHDHRLPRHVRRSAPAFAAQRGRARTAPPRWTGRAWPRCSLWANERRGATRANLGNLMSLGDIYLPPRSHG